MGKRSAKMTVIPRDVKISKDRARPALSNHPSLIQNRMKNFSGLEKKRKTG